MVGADVFMINGKTILCIVDSHNKFPIVKKLNSLSTDNRVQTAKLIFAEYRPTTDCFRCGYKLHILDIQGLLQEDKYPAKHSIVIPPQKQWSGRSMYKICKVYF